ncbi:helicase-exonuclease AddAB subunit AddB [Alkaliphilus peptidifermentans]|uniref:ATP-dependent helicase/deoxyribonuclease subunit B n=1 Tax=Alkaliphilus peptidifermentans DSM 18978 TaxID=1120976 RepID=A0A1G5GF10_9FIRM|nr:helicase-exonuclease AddAB subunit AddB [Alkaliphilus peptidifermentans]SCY50143.1 DNA helicase/exodeoxyribonuclease V, subunit B [Alkaliphilus peptidifermentans DSM 18978]
MSIRYILGRSGAGKSQFVYESICENITDKTTKQFLIVPEQFTLQAERDLITKGNLKGIMDVEVLSFSRLAFRVLSEVGGLTKTHINDIGKNMIIRRLLTDLEKELSIYQKTIRQTGFVAKLNSLITEMKQHDIIPQHLKNQLEELEENSLLKMKLSDVATIYEAFNQYLENRYIDTEDHINLLIEKLESTKIFDDTIIWIDGFHKLTPQTFRIIEKIMLKAKQLNITFTLDPEPREGDGDLFKLTNQTYNRIKKLTKDLGGFTEEVINIYRANKTDDFKNTLMEHMEEEFYAYPYKIYKGELKGLKLFAASNHFTEVENAAAEIVSLVREKQYRWRDIAVVSGGLDGYSMLLKSVFQEYDIPFFMDEKRSIIDHPIIEVILSAIDIISNNYRPHDVFRFLRTGFSDLTKDQWEELENFCLQYGVKGNRWFSEFNKSKDYDMEEINNSREKLCTPFLVLSKEIKKANNIAEITKGLFYFLKDLRIEEKLNAWIEALKEQGRYDYVNENTQIWNTVMEMFDQLSEILGDQKVTLKEYRDILDSGFAATEIGVIPSTIDQVLIGSIERSRSHNIKALFLIGVNDGILPALGAEDGILQLHERNFLTEAGITLGYEGESQLYEEKLSIYTILSKPSEYLWVSYSLADQEGKALRPSILVDRFRKLYPQVPICSDVINTLEQQLHLVTTPSSTFKYMIDGFRLFIDDNEMEDIWWDVYRWYYNNPLWNEKRHMMIQGLFHKNQIYYIPEVKARNLYSTPIHTSISRLEGFSNCPFSHFVSYGLKPKERKTYEIKNPDIGKLFHDALEQFEKQLKTNGIDWKGIDKEYSDKVVENIIDEMAGKFQEGIFYSSNRYRYLLQRLKRISKRALWTLTLHLKQGSFTSYGHEISFGQEGDIPPIVIQLETGEEIHLEGRIDRVDFYEDEDGTYVKVIDYKSSDKDLSLTDVYYGLQLQLLVYIDAIISIGEYLKKDKIYPAGVFYFKIDDPLIRTTDRAIETIEKEISKSLKMKGFALKDISIIKEIDTEIDRSSNIIPVSINKGDEISKNSSVLSLEEFKLVTQHIRNLIKDIAGEITKGNVKIEPCKKGNMVSCKYCQYLSICQFDRLIDDNQYRVIKELKQEEIIGKIAAKKEGDADA